MNNWIFRTKSIIPFIIFTANIVPKIHIANNLYFRFFR